MAEDFDKSAVSGQLSSGRGRDTGGTPALPLDSDGFQEVFEVETGVDIAEDFSDIGGLEVAADTAVSNDGDEARGIDLAECAGFIGGKFRVEELGVVELGPGVEELGVDFSGAAGLGE
jgi:hypothetical protein